MKIAVCAKQIPDPANEVSYSEGIINRPEEQVLDDTDRYGIEVALQLKEKYDAEVTIISMGPSGTQKGLQQALQIFWHTYEEKSFIAKKLQVHHTA